MKKVYLSILSATIVGLVACGETKQNVVAPDTLTNVAPDTLNKVAPDTTANVAPDTTAKVEAPAAH